MTGSRRCCAWPATATSLRVRPSPELDHVTRTIPRPLRARLLRWTAALVLLGGYAALADGGLTLAPVLLALGYVVLVPLAFLAR